MISRDMKLTDLDTAMMHQFASYLDRLRSNRRQLSIWHEDGIVRRSLIGDEVVSSGLVRIEDARRISENLYRVYENEVERVLITDFEGKNRMVASWNIKPRENEHPYEYLRRRIDSLTAQFDSKLAIYPELKLDRGPVDIVTASRIMDSLVGESTCSLLLAVVDGTELEMILVAKIKNGRVIEFTNVKRCESIRESVEMDDGWLEKICSVVSEVLDTDKSIACCLSPRMIRRLYDGRTKIHIPYGYREKRDYLTFPGNLVELESHEPAVYIPGIFAYIPFPDLLDSSVPV